MTDAPLDMFALRYAMAMAGVTEISEECDMVEMTSLNEADPTWSFTDAAGHVHRWAGDWRTAHLPTLNLIVDHACDEYCPDEYHGPYAHYECKECGARVEPATMPSPQRRFEPGLPRLTWR